jgi:hypothetical protein
MNPFLATALLAVVTLAATACASGSYSSSSSSSGPRARCLVNPNETGSRPLVFLFCAESP